MAVGFARAYHPTWQKRETADRIAEKMTKEGHKVDSLHGKLDTAERDRTIDAFRDGKSKVLISTNVIARGIDILQVTCVINYDMPLSGDNQADAETYLHRIGEQHLYIVDFALLTSCPFGTGRTGRFGRKGISINFVHDQASWQLMNQIEKKLQCSITRVPTTDFEEMEKIIKDCECCSRSIRESKG